MHELNHRGQESALTLTKSKLTQSFWTISKTKWILSVIAKENVAGKSKHARKTDAATCGGLGCANGLVMPTPLVA